MIDFAHQMIADGLSARSHEELPSFEQQMAVPNVADKAQAYGVRGFIADGIEPAYGKRLVNYDLAYVSYYIEDGDYLKLDNATVGYTFREGSLGRLSRWQPTGGRLLPVPVRTARALPHPW